MHTATQHQFQVGSVDISITLSGGPYYKDRAVVLAEINALVLKLNAEGVARESGAFAGYANGRGCGVYGQI